MALVPIPGVEPGNDFAQGLALAIQQLRARMGKKPVQIPHGILNPPPGQGFPHPLPTMLGHGAPTNPLPIHPVPTAAGRKALGY